MNDKLKYRINIIWSEEDNCYLVGLPDFPGQTWVTHGDTYQEAFTHGMEVMEELHLAVINGDLPSPKITTVQPSELQYK